MRLFQLPTRYRWPLSLVLVIFGPLWPGVSVAAQGATVPADVQFTVLAKALTFDRNLRRRAGSELVIGVVYQSGFRASRQAKDEFLAAVRSSPITSIDGLPIRAVEVELRDPDQLTAQLAAARVNIVYLTPLRAVGVERLLAGSATSLSWTGVPEYVRSGAIMGVATRGGRPSILVNLRAARAAGVDFGSQLLRLAQVVE